MRVLGFEFWLLPEIFVNDKFFPLVTFEWADDGIWGYLYRVASKAFFLMASFGFDCLGRGYGHD